MYRNRCFNYNYNYLNFIKKTCWIIIFIFSIVIFSLVTYFNYEIFDSCLRYIVNNNLITNYKVNEKGRVPISLYNLDELCELEYMVNNLASLDFYLFLVLIISIYFYIKKNKDNNKKYKVFFNVFIICLIIGLCFNAYVIEDIRLDLYYLICDFCKLHLNMDII